MDVVLLRSLRFRRWRLFLLWFLLDFHDGVVSVTGAPFRIFHSHLGRWHHVGRYWPGLVRKEIILVLNSWMPHTRIIRIESHWRWRWRWAVRWRTSWHTRHRRRRRSLLAVHGPRSWRWRRRRRHTRSLVWPSGRLLSWLRWRRPWLRRHVHHRLIHRRLVLMHNWS